MPVTTSSTSKSSTSAANVFEGFDHYDSQQQQQQNQNHQQHHSLLFTPKFQYSTKNNPLCGICFFQWFQLVQHRYHQIEWKIYWPRLLMITFISIFNSILAIIENIYLYYYFGSTNLDNVTINPNPVFVLGHPRTGTTLLHSILALDEEQFTYCSTFCAGFPSCFLWFESIGKILFQNVMDETRPMDNVKLHFDLPQEDELATNMFTAGSGEFGGISPYMPLFFMKQEPEFRPYYSFGTTTTCNHKTTKTDKNDNDKTDNDNYDDTYLPPKEMAAARNEWTRAFLHLLKKLTLRSMILQTKSKQQQQHSHHSNRPHKRLVLKSPVHTARIPLLIQLFPNAQFIYIHRHPYQVLQSAIHMADTTYWYTYLNTPTETEILEFIVRQYEILWNDYEYGRQELLLLALQQEQQQREQKERRQEQQSKEQQQERKSSSESSSPLPEQHQQQENTNTNINNNSIHPSFIEISFDELVQDPIKTMEKIYHHFQWELSPIYQERLLQEFQSLNANHGKYQPNIHKELPNYLKAIVNQRWGPSFERLGYIKDEINNNEKKEFNENEMDDKIEMKRGNVNETNDNDDEQSPTLNKNNNNNNDNNPNNINNDHDKNNPKQKKE